MRIVGWKGRADQATKVRGMFVRPEQVAGVLSKHPEVTRARLEVGHDGATDTLTAKLEGAGDAAALSASLADVIKLRPTTLELVPDGALPRDGVVIKDLREI